MDSFCFKMLLFDWSLRQKRGFSVNNSEIFRFCPFSLRSMTALCVWVLLTLNLSSNFLLSLVCSFFSYWSVRLTYGLKISVYLFLCLLLSKFVALMISWSLNNEVLIDLGWSYINLSGSNIEWSNSKLSSSF
jgi:hypothetical protein